MKYDDLFVRYIDYFNVQRDYFECHEVLEELWLQNDRDLLIQGLLQVAVALYHFRNDNRIGAEKMMNSVLNKWNAYNLVEQTRIWGIDLLQLRQEVEVYALKLKQYDAVPFSFYDLNIRVLDPELVRQVQELQAKRMNAE